VSKNGNMDKMSGKIVTVGQVSKIWEGSLFSNYWMLLDFRPLISSRRDTLDVSSSG